MSLFGEVTSEKSKKKYFTFGLKTQQNTNNFPCIIRPENCKLQ